MNFSLFFENKNTADFYFSDFENFIPQFRHFFHEKSPVAK